LEILVAEDDTDAADLYKATLEARGHRVDTTFDGRECLSRYQSAMRRLAASGGKPSDHQPYDAVILDYKIPNVDGLQVAREMLRLNPHQRIIFASAYTKDTLADSVKELKQVVELVQKPFEPEILVDIIEDKSMAKKLDELNAVARNISRDNANPPENEINVLLERLKNIQKEGTLS
jgi:CheY-like chemotaxis protein